VRLEFVALNVRVKNVQLKNTAQEKHGCAPLAILSHFWVAFSHAAFSESAFIFPHFTLNFDCAHFSFSHSQLPHKHSKNGTVTRVQIYQ